MQSRLQSASLCGFRVWWSVLSLFICSAIGRLAAQAPYEPPDGTVYHGVGWGSGAQEIYIDLFDEAHQPLLYQSIFGIPGNPLRPFTVESITDWLRPRHIDPESQYAELSVHITEDGSVMLDSAFAFTDAYDSYMDTLAKALVLHDRPFFLRIGLEMNGPWNGYTPWIFPVAFRKLVEGLRSRGVTKMATVWCYEPDAEADFADSTEAGWKWYPGDDVVDWFSLDVFDADHFDPDLPDSTGTRPTKKGRSELFLQFAEARDRPVYLNEVSARGVFIVPDGSDPDSAEGKADWDLWFDPFFRFLEDHPLIKAFNYINLDWTQIDQYVTWGDARIEINTVIRERWIAEMQKTRYLHRGTDIAHPTAVRPASLRDESANKAIVLTVRPNPFNAETNIRFTIDRPGFIEISLFDCLGRRIRRITDGRYAAGIHSITWSAEDLPSGLYLIILRSPERIDCCKVTLLR